MTNKEIKDRINQLKKEKDAVILAHYYVDGEIQSVADYVGDSYALSKLAKSVGQQTIVFCGVSFMGESAKILNPDKKVVMPDTKADCPMAHMVSAEAIEKVRKCHEDVAVVCYVNSTAEIKAHADVCVTSSNALKIVRALPNKKIFFIPDNNLGRYIAAQVPEKEFIFNDGYCPIHKEIAKEDVLKARIAHPEAEVLTHPECVMDVLGISDYIGSTSEIIDYATKSEKKEFIICTETGVFYELEMKNPEKKFYQVMPDQICPGMKKNTLENLLKVLETLEGTVDMPEQLRLQAKAPLEKMLELAK